MSEPESAGRGILEMPEIRVSTLEKRVAMLHENKRLTDENERLREENERLKSFVPPYIHEQQRKRWERRRDQAEAYQDALREIADPISAMRERAEREGKVLDGPIAVELADNANYLKRIARTVLEQQEAISRASLGDMMQEGESG